MLPVGSKGAKEKKEVQQHKTLGRLLKMKCPVCENINMREVEKNGVLVDICPDCKGVWLDRGELDKLMSGVREMREEYNQLQERNTGYENREYDNRPYKGNDRESAPQYKKKKKKETVLDIFGDLFGG
jgi:Zn-finger nucleic acid-binding protein